MLLLYLFFDFENKLKLEVVQHSKSVCLALPRNTSANFADLAGDFDFTKKDAYKRIDCIMVLDAQN